MSNRVLYIHRILKALRERRGGPVMRVDVTSSIFAQHGVIVAVRNDWRGGYWFLCGRQYGPYQLASDIARTFPHGCRFRRYHRSHDYVPAGASILEQREPTIRNG